MVGNKTAAGFEKAGFIELVLNHFQGLVQGSFQGLIRDRFKRRCWVNLKSWPKVGAG